MVFNFLTETNELWEPKKIKMCSISEEWKGRIELDQVEGRKKKTIMYGKFEISTQLHKS